MAETYRFRYNVLDEVGGKTIVARAEWYYDKNKAVYPWYRLVDLEGKKTWILATKLDFSTKDNGEEDPPPDCPEPPC